MLAHHLKDQPNIFFTSGLTCAIEMSKLKWAKVSLPGGNMNLRSLSLNGIEGVRFLEKINFDIAFMGVTRYDDKTGFTCESLEDAVLKRTVIQRAEKVIVLMDSSKIDKKGTYTICTLDDVDAVVSADMLTEVFKEKCKNLGIAVY